jgi:outer membrane protein
MIPLKKGEKMRCTKVCLIAFLFIAILLTAGFSQQTLVLNIEKSVNIALEQNPQFRIAKKELQKAEADIWQAYSSILPQLDASANFERNWKIQQTTIPNFIKTMLGSTAPPGMPDFVQIAFGLENTMQYGASVTQPLFLGGAGVAGIKTAYAAKKISRQNLEMVRQDLVFQTVNAFYACLLARELLAVQQEALEQEKVNLRMVQKKYDVGTASGFDRMRAKVEVANRQPQVISSQNDYQLAVTQLKNVLGLKPEVNVELEGAFIYNEDPIDTLGLRELQAIARQNRPELLALDQQLVIAKKGITLARSSFLPKLYFSTSYSFLAMRNDFKFAQDDFSEGFTSSISLQVPLFHGFSNIKKYQQAKLDEKIVLDTEKQVTDGVMAELESAYNKFDEAKEKYAAAGESVDLAREALRLANLMYEEGTNTQLDVMSSQLALNQARMNYASSIYEYQLARYQLRKAAGILQGVL